MVICNFKIGLKYDRLIYQWREVRIELTLRAYETLVLP